MKYECEGRQGSWAMVSALRVVSVRAGKVGVGEANYFGGYLSDFQERVSIGEAEHDDIPGGMVQEDGFNNTSL